MAKLGGKRKGSGRPKGSKGKKTIEQKLALERLRKKVRDNWDNLINDKLRLAEGVFIKVKGKNVLVVGKGKKKKKLIRVYRKPPDGAAIEYLISMVVGKPKEEAPPPSAVTIYLINENVEKARKRVAAKKKKK